MFKQFEQSLAIQLLICCLCPDAMAHRGDRVGCRVIFDEQTEFDVPVSFTLNGREVGRASLKSGGPLYPCIGMGYEGIRVLFTVSIKMLFVKDFQ